MASLLQSFNMGIDRLYIEGKGELITLRHSFFLVRYSAVQNRHLFFTSLTSHVPIASSATGAIVSSSSPYSCTVHF